MSVWVHVAESGERGTDLDGQIPLWTQWVPSVLAGRLPQAGVRELELPAGDMRDLLVSFM